MTQCISQLHMALPSMKHSFDFNTTFSLMLIRSPHSLLVESSFSLNLKRYVIKCIFSVFLFCLHDLLLLMCGVCPFIWLLWYRISGKILFLSNFPDYYLSLEVVWTSQNIIVQVNSLCSVSLSVFIKAGGHRK